MEDITGSRDIQIYMHKFQEVVSRSVIIKILGCWSPHFFKSISRMQCEINDAGVCASNVQVHVDVQRVECFSNNGHDGGKNEKSQE